MSVHNYTQSVGIQCMYIPSLESTDIIITDKLNNIVHTYVCLYISKFPE